MALPQDEHILGVARTCELVVVNFMLNCCRNTSFF